MVETENIYFLKLILTNLPTPQQAPVFPNLNYYYIPALLPLYFVYWKPKNLKDNLVRSKLKGEKASVT